MGYAPQGDELLELSSVTAHWPHLPRRLATKSSQEELNIRPQVPSHLRRQTPWKILLRALVLALIGVHSGPTLRAKDKPPVQYKIPIPTLPDFTALDWLQGQWTGKTAANSPAGNVQLSVSLDLEKHFLVFRGEVSLAATPTVPAMRESWLGILSAGADRNDFILRIFSSTGFITRYRMIVDGAEIRLNPEGGDSPPPGWLFRRIWTRTGPDEFSETLQAAPPGKGFFDYYTAKFARVPPPPKTSPAP